MGNIFGKDSALPSYFPAREAVLANTRSNEWLIADHPTSFGNYNYITQDGEVVRPLTPVERQVVIQFISTNKLKVLSINEQRKRTFTL